MCLISPFWSLDSPAQIFNLPTELDGPLLPGTAFFVPWPRLVSGRPADASTTYSLLFPPFLSSRFNGVSFSR